MKFSHILSGAAAVALAVGSFGAQAGTQNKTMNVMAMVLAKCTIDTISPQLDFGDFTQETGNKDVTTSLAVTCPVGTPYNIGLGGFTGAQRFLANGTDNLEYQLYLNAGYTNVWGTTIGTDTFAGTGTGASVPTTIYGRIFDNLGNRAVPPGAYNATVPVTVSY